MKLGLIRFKITDCDRMKMTFFFRFLFNSISIFYIYGVEVTVIYKLPGRKGLKSIKVESNR